MTSIIASIAVIIISSTALLLRRHRKFSPAKPPSECAILITGGSRGIGKSTAKYLLQKGYVVLVTVRKQSQVDELLLETNIIDGISQTPVPVLLDVTDDSHMGPAVDRVRAILEEKKVVLVAVVNNAGINPEGDAISKRVELEEQIVLPEDTNKLSDMAVASRVFETNVIGVARVTRAFLPLLSKGGRVVNIGSYFGSLAGAVGLEHAYYEASKFALEGLSDNLRRGLRNDGIWVSLIKPGNILTDMNPHHGEVGSEVVAVDIEHAANDVNPLPRYYPGKFKGYSVRFLCWVFETFPTRITDHMV